MSGYALIIVGLAGGVDRVGPFVTFPLAVITMKGQASNADALHDYAADRSDPFKNHVPTAVDTLGRRTAIGVFVGRIVVSVATDSPSYLVAGIVSITLGITYSFPPRFKERGVVNHLVTTVVCPSRGRSCRVAR